MIAAPPFDVGLTGADKVVSETAAPLACRIALLTICACNYLPFARVLLDSARSHQPDAALFICLADILPNDGCDIAPGCTVIEAEKLGIPDFPAFAFRYGILEFSTALKPFAIRHIMETLGFDRIIYLDPDIELHSSLDSVLAPLDAGASLVLTPHLLSPAEDDNEPDDVDVMRVGVFNLGFIAFSRCEEARRILAWWSRRLRLQCVNEPEAGLFVDQKFIDLVPGFAPHARISHDPNLNVAYWNLRQRRLEDAADGGWLVDGIRLGFFHFSGFDPDRPAILSKYDRHFAGRMPPPLQRLTDCYAQRLRAAGYGKVPSMAHAYSRFTSGARIPDHARRMFRALRHWPDDPFATFEAFMDQPWPGDACILSGHRVTNFIKFLHDERTVLRARLDITRPEHVRELVDWFVRLSWREEHIDPQLVAPAAERVGRQRPHATAVRGPDVADVAVISYHRATSGVSQAGLSTMSSLRSAGVAAETFDAELPPAAAPDTEDGPPCLKRSTAAALIYNVNADQLPSVTAGIRDRVRHDAVRICIPFWELDRFPEPWLPGLRAMDEIWAPSRFIQMVLAPLLNQPVLHMPVAVDFAIPPPVSRSAFGLPECRFLFLATFDIRSYLTRKNPMAAIAAFRMAFPAGSGAGLVLKCLNAGEAPEQLAALRELIGEHPDIVMITDTLDRAHTLALIAATDALVSLHRSEGLGLPIAEAMLIGRPVIATDYSGSRDFLSPATGFPVEHRLIPVGENEYPFWQGQRWAEPDTAHAAWIMRRLKSDPGMAAGRVAAAAALIRERHSHLAVGRLQRARLRILVP